MSEQEPTCDICGQPSGEEGLYTCKVCGGEFCEICGDIAEETCDECQEIQSHFGEEGDGSDGTEVPPLTREETLRSQLQTAAQAKGQQRLCSK